MRTVIEDSVKREIVAMIQSGHKASDVAERVGVKLETVRGNWRKWEKEIMDELPDTVKAYVKPAETMIDHEDEEPEVLEVDKVTEEPRRKKRSSPIEATVELIKTIDRLICEHLEAGHDIASLEIKVDEGNMVEFSCGRHQESGKLRAQLCMWVTMEEE